MLLRGPSARKGRIRVVRCGDPATCTQTWRPVKRGRVEKRGAGRGEKPPCAPDIVPNAAREGLRASCISVTENRAYRLAVPSCRRPPREARLPAPSFFLAVRRVRGSSARACGGGQTAAFRRDPRRRGLCGLSRFASPRRAPTASQGGRSRVRSPLHNRHPAPRSHARGGSRRGSHRGRQAHGGFPR